MDRKRVVWVQPEPTPYWAHVFRAIEADPELELSVWFLRENTSHHPWESDLRDGYPSIVPSYTLGLEWSYLARTLDEDGFVIVSRWSTLMSALIVNLLHLQGYPFGICTDTPDLGRARGTVKSTLRSVWLKWLFSRVSRMLATGQPGVRALETMGCPSEKIVNFPFFVDLDFYAPGNRRRDRGEGELRLVSSGRLKNSDKGYDLALKALSRAREGTDTDFRYRIAGEGPDEEELRSLVETLGLQGDVEFLGWQEPEELRDVYLDSDAMVHPAPTHDPFPVTVLEGMAAGLPILGSRAAGSVQDRVKHGFNGFVHEPGNMDQLSDHLVDLTKRDASTMGQRARKTAEEWPVERGVGILKEVLKSV